MKEDRFLTMEEVGHLIGLDRSTIYNWKRRGVLPYYKVGKRAVRFKLAEVLQWMETQKEKGSLNRGCKAKGKISNKDK